MIATKLPYINQKDAISSDNFNKTATEAKSLSDAGGKFEHVSPFRLPGDDEVFVYREMERKKRDELKMVSQDLKVWDKKTGTSRRPLRLFKDFDGHSKGSAKSFAFPGYNNKEKQLITEAQRIINERRKDRDALGKETRGGVLDLIEQKKEMFLVEMTVGIIEKEKDVLIQKSGEKEDALKKSDEMLEKDWEEFETYKTHNKQETDMALQRYNQEVESRKRTEQQFKKKNNDLTSLRADKTKNEEMIQKYLDAKNFLDKLTPKEYLEQHRKQLEAKVEEIKAQFMEHEISLREETHSAVSSENLNINLSKNVSNIKDKKHLGGRKPLRVDIERLFLDKLDKGDFEEIEDLRLNQKMYFTETDQLIEIFMRLEEDNLAAIQMMQDTEQTLDNLKNSLKIKKAEFDRKIGGLRENKMQLDKSKHEKEDQIKGLVTKSKEPILSKNADGLLPLRKKIIEIFNILKEEQKTAVDYENISTLDLLASVELGLEKQLEKLNEFKPARVMEVKRQSEDVRKRNNRKLQIEREQAIAEEKSRKASERALEKTKKRTGRPDMSKSKPVEKEEVVVQVAQNTDEEEDMKYFKPYLTKF